jgi:hypothetical protein
MVNETLMAVRSLAPVLRDSVNMNPDLESHGEI